jgi:phosphoglycolate phosphatase
MTRWGVIFDFDGTLADTLPDIADAVNAGLRSFGLAEQPSSLIQQWVGDGLPTLCRRALAAAGQPVNLEDLVAIVTASYREHRLRKTKPFPGIPEMLDQLTQSGVLIAILTNKPHEHTGPMADALFASWSWAAIEGYREESRKKPDPRTALEIVERMQLEPSRVLMVGDSAADVYTAINAGLIPVGATWGYRSRDELISSGAKHLIDHPQQLFPLLISAM